MVLEKSKTKCKWDLLLNCLSGANKQVYAPEPFDVGRILLAEITLDGGKFFAYTTGPIDPGLFMILNMA